MLLDSGCELSSEHHVIDVANVLKLFFRELPQPLIPYMFHDTLLQSLIQKKGDPVKSLLLTCLLLPLSHLYTLSYFMEVSLLFIFVSSYIFVGMLLSKHELHFFI